MAGEAVLVAVARPDARPARAGGGRGDQRLRPQPQGPAARRPRRLARHDGPRSRHPHRRESRGGGRHRQALGHRHRLSLPAEERPARRAGGTCEPHPQAQGRTDRHRQRHRQPRDGAPRGRHALGHARAEAAQGDRVGGRRVGLFGLGDGGGGVPAARRVAARGRLHRPPFAGPAGRTGQDRTEIHRRRPVPARRRPDPPCACARRRGGGRGERRPPLCSLACRGWALRWPKPSLRIATKPARSETARNC